MNLKDVVLGYTKYKMNKMLITIPGIAEPYNVDRNFISTIIIDKDYDNFMFPFFEIDVAVPNYIYRAMKKNNQNLRAYIDLQYTQFKNVEYQVDAQTLAGFASYVNDNFYIFMEDMTPEANESVIEQKEKNDGTFGKGMALGDTTLVKLLLYKEDYLFKSKTVVNDILSSATLIDALTFVLNKSGLTKVLITPPNNYKSYSEFVITPVTAMEQIDRICNEFGMHTNGTLIFFDFKAIFIIDRNPKCTAWVPNEYKTTYLVSCPATAQGSTLARGCYFNSKEKYSLLNFDPESMIIKSKSVVNDQIMGNNFININVKTGNIESVYSGASKAIGSLSTPTRVIITTKGDSTSSAIKQEMAENSKVISLAFSYVNLNCFDPNKEFIFSIDDTKFAKYNGKYRIIKKTAIFQKEGEYFVPHVVAEFKGN